MSSGVAEQNVLTRLTPGPDDAGVLRMRRLRAAGAGLAFAGALAVVVVLSVGQAAAAPALGPPAGWPDLSTMSLATADLSPGAKVARQGYVKPDTDFLAEYDREFRSLSAKLGAKRLTAIEDDVMLAKTSDDADAFIDVVPLGLSLALDNMKSGFAAESGFKVTYAKLGKPTKLGVGDNSFAVTIRFGTRIGEIRRVFAGVRVGQVVHGFYFAGLPRGRVGVADAKRLARALVERTQAALVPSGVTAPTVSGAPQVGQTLAALPGTWLGFPTSYTYQWERCDATGASCVAVTDATAQSYVVTADDLAATLTVVVGAQNSYGTGTATAVATAPVTAPAG